ncbi:TPA: SMP-30/gluconolactonase/LRE family protein [Candidatus Poribacteria bacterium]|nr:SMP-30/gluconolactonase/LRE family protein [Candidatus Poribacteria bacterium]
MSSEFRRIVPEDAQVEQLGTGFNFTEGPLWVAAWGFLLFSDMPADRIRKWTPTEGVTNFRVPCGKSNGLTLDKQGRLIACEHANRRVSRTEYDGAVVAIASHYEGKKLNSPNDVIVKSDGSIYFSDPPYGLTAEFGEPGERELDFCGVYRLSPDGETLTLLADDFATPNGLAFSPDESLLYIDDTERMHIRVFDVKEDGTIANGRIFAEESGEEGAPDGLKVDSEGNVYVTGPGGIWLFNPAGEHLGTIELPEGAANFAWGDSDWKTLYITATTSLYRIRLNIKGIPVP